MPDKEALIHAIELRENIEKRDHHGFVDLPYEMVGNVLAMLKEQETVEHAKEILCANGWEKMRFPEGTIGKWDDPEIVRCKDCKYHGNIYPDYCVNLEQNTNDDFYCADGVSKDE